MKKAKIVAIGTIQYADGIPYPEGWCIGWWVDGIDTPETPGILYDNGIYLYGGHTIDELIEIRRRYDAGDTLEMLERGLSED